MTPKQLEEIRERIDARPDWVDHPLMAKALLAEVDRLNRELTLTRLELESAWAACDEKEGTE